MAGRAFGVCQSVNCTDHKGEYRMDSLQQLSREIDELRDDLGAELMAAQIGKRSIEAMASKLKDLKEKVDLLQIESDRKEVGKW